MTSTFSTQSKMKTWIDERSFDQITQDTIATGRYDYITELIQRNPNVFRSNDTIYDITVCDNYRKLADLETNLKSIEEQITKEKQKQKAAKQRAAEEAAKRQAKTKGKPLPKIERSSKVDIEDGAPPDDDMFDDEEFDKPSMERTRYDELQSDELNLIQEIEKQKLFIHLLERHQTILRKKYVSLNRAAQDYKRSENLETLRKAVQWISEYTEGLIAREEQLPEELRLKPFTPLVHDGSAW